MMNHSRLKRKMQTHERSSGVPKRSFVTIQLKSKGDLSRDVLTDILLKVEKKLERICENTIDQRPSSSFMVDRLYELKGAGVIKINYDACGNNSLKRSFTHNDSAGNVCLKMELNVAANIAFLGFDESSREYKLLKAEIDEMVDEYVVL